MGQGMDPCVPRLSAWGVSFVPGAPPRSPGFDAIAAAAMAKKKKKKKKKKAKKAKKVAQAAIQSEATQRAAAEAQWRAIKAVEDELPSRGVASDIGQQNQSAADE